MDVTCLLLIFRVYFAPYIRSCYAYARLYGSDVLWITRVNDFAAEFPRAMVEIESLFIGSINSHDRKVVPGPPRTGSLKLAEWEWESAMNMLRRPVVAGFLIGAGLAGLMDGIFLHQILQWHHLVCVQSHCQATSIADLKHKNFQDGVFHAGVLSLLLVGLTLLYGDNGQGAQRSSGKLLMGATLLGMGVFNLLEGLIDHEILQIHHVHPGSYQTQWDMGFLALACGLILCGWRLQKQGERELLAAGHSINAANSADSRPF